MRKLTPAITVGLVVIASGVVFAYLFGAVEKRTTEEDESYLVYAVLDDVSGLAVHSRVTMSGIPIGEIEEIGLDLVTGRKARVTIRLQDRIQLHAGEPDASGRLVNGAVLTRRQASLLGDYYLDLTPGVAGPVLFEEDEIPTVVSVTGLAAMMEQMENSGDFAERLDKITANVEQVTASLAAVLGGDSGTVRMERVAEDIAVATGNIAVLTDDMRVFMNDGLLSKRDNFDRIVGNIDRFTQDAARISQRIDSSLERSLGNLEAFTGELKGIASGSSGKVQKILSGVEVGLARVDKSLDTLDQSLGNVRDITGMVKDGKGTVGRLVTDSHLADSVEETVDDLGGLVKSISRLQTKVELRVEYGFLEESTKTYFTLKLQPRWDRYYAIEVIDDPRGNTSFLSEVTQTNDPSLPPVLRESTTRTTDDLKFSVYFAKRFYFMMARIGIIESSGGVGLDMLLLNDSLKVAFDVFNFGLGKNPRLRAGLTWTVFDHLMIMGGVDDIINDDRRDYFFGLGITFTDEDLKALLTVAPVPSVQ